MSTDPSHMKLLRDLLGTQILGVLGTHSDGAPYTSLVGFAATEDLRHLLFTTGRSTRKYANLLADPRASMLVDNRTNQSSDFTEAAAATAVGTVEEVPAEGRDAFEAVFLEKLPHLDDFLRSPTCAWMRLRVSVYYVVTQFQHVIEIHADS
jgi:hypothetical protein